MKKRLSLFFISIASALGFGLLQTASIRVWLVVLVEQVLHRDILNLNWENRLAEESLRDLLFLHSIAPAIVLPRNFKPSKRPFLATVCSMELY
jgi:hypothetical protein